MSGITQGELKAGTAAVRAALEKAGYSSFVSDEQCQQVAYDVLKAAVDVREAREKHV
jgi:hypothetical protein